MRWPCGALLASTAASVALQARRPQVPTSTSCSSWTPSSSGISSWSWKAEWTLSSASVAVSIPASAATLFFHNKGFWCHTARSCGFEVFSKKVTTASSIQHRASPPDRWQIHPAWPHGAARAWSPRPRLCSGASEAAEVSDCPSTHPVVGPS